MRTILGLFALALSTGTARAYCRATTTSPPNSTADAGIVFGNCPADGIPLFWKSECLGVHIDEAASESVSLSQTRQLLTGAFAEWKAAKGMCLPSIDVIQLDPVSSPKIGYSGSGAGENDLVFHDQEWPYRDRVAFDHVTASFDHETGELLDVDVEINATLIALHLSASDASAEAPELHTLFLHLVGHFLGFAHSYDFRSVMYPLLSPGDPVQTLTDDDAAGMCAVYPENGDRPTLDARGRPTTVPSSACNLSAAPASPCSGGAIKLDHGCSIALGRRTSPASDALLVASLFSMCAARLRRRRGTYEPVTKRRQ